MSSISRSPGTPRDFIRGHKHYSVSDSCSHWQGWLIRRTSLKIRNCCTVYVGPKGLPGILSGVTNTARSLLHQLVNWKLSFSLYCTQGWNLVCNTTNIKVYSTVYSVQSILYFKYKVFWTCKIFLDCPLFVCSFAYALVLP